MYIMARKWLTKKSIPNYNSGCLCKGNKDLGTRIGKDEQEEYHPDLKCPKFLKDNAFQYCRVIRNIKIARRNQMIQD